MKKSREFMPQMVRKPSRIWVILEVAQTIATIAFLLWFFISWANVIATNLPNNPAVPAAWNLFEIITKLF